MKREDFESKMRGLVAKERHLTTDILKMIIEAELRRHHLDCGYSSIFSWLTEAHGYSESAAQRRIQAARLMKSVPEVAEKIENGKVNLTTLAKTQTAIRAQERLKGKMPAQKKAEVVRAIEDKSGLQTELHLANLFPQARPLRETKTHVGDNIIRLGLNMDFETIENLTRIRELLSHIMPNANLADIIKYISEEFLKRKDPLLKTDATGAAPASAAAIPTLDGNSTSIVTTHAQATAAATKQCVNRSRRKSIPKRVRRMTIKKADAKCEYRDPKTGRVCGSKFQLEIDHIIPVALGGTDDPENLRCLCRAHNQRLAEKMYG